MASTVDGALFVHEMDAKVFFEGARRVPAARHHGDVHFAGASGEKGVEQGIALELLRSMEGTVAPDQALRKGWRNGRNVSIHDYIQGIAEPLMTTRSRAIDCTFP